MGILAVLFNRQVMRYAGPDSLAVYGVIINISTTVQCTAYSIGQAAQPIMSANFGAGQWDRVRQSLRYAIWAAAGFGLIWTAVIWLLPQALIHVFMSPTPSVLEAAPYMMRCYGLSFLLLPLNIFSAYYFQALLKPGVAFGLSACRGLVVSGALIFLLPALFGGGAMWFAMPLTELLVAAGAVYLLSLIHICELAACQQNAKSQGQGGQLNPAHIHPPHPGSRQMTEYPLRHSADNNRFGSMCRSARLCPCRSAGWRGWLR